MKNNNEPVTCTAIRPFVVVDKDGRRVVAPGEVVKLPKVLASELKSANKVEYGDHGEKKGKSRKSGVDPVEAAK